MKRAFLAALSAAVFVMPVSADAGLLFGPAVKVKTVNHFYGASPAAVAAVSPSSVRLSHVYLAPAGVAVMAGPAVAVSRSKKAAKHAGKAVKHQRLAEYYGG